jgi:glutamine synthetase
VERREDSDHLRAGARDILAVVAERAIQTISLQFTDIGGHAKGVSIPSSQLATALADGQWVDGSCIASSVRLHESDMLLRPVPATFTVLPAEGTHQPLARVICDVCTLDGRPFAGDPRHVLWRALAAAAERGFAYHVAPEIEFFICEVGSDGRLRPLPEDQDGYFDLTADPGAHLCHDLVIALRGMGMAVESSHHEVASSQHEIDLAATDALQAADNVATLKYVARHLARQQGLRVTFMPKPFNGLSGSGMHIHQMLLDSATATNRLSGRGHHVVSDLARHFIAGQLHHAAALTAVTNPLVNSYKRLAGGFEAPSTITWAHENRSAYIRVPYVPSAHPELTRVELRGSDPACNPYLAFAVMLRAGLAGIDEQMPTPEPREEQVHAFDLSERPSLEVTPLPTSLGDALLAFSASRLMRETFEEYVFGHFVEMKRREWRAYQTQVTSWEQDLCWETA